MRGVVKLVNAADEVFAVETEHGEYTVFGLLESCTIEEGDVVSGPLEALDQQIFVNETRERKMMVYVEDVELTLEVARSRVA